MYHDVSLLHGTHQGRSHPIICTGECFFIIIFSFIGFLLFSNEYIIEEDNLMNFADRAREAITLSHLAVEEIKAIEKAMNKLTRFNIIKTLVIYVWFVRRKRWYLRFPFLPLPPKRWLLWRIETAWGIQADNFRWKDLPPIRIIIKDMMSFGRFLTLMKDVGR